MKRRLVILASLALLGAPSANAQPAPGSPIDVGPAVGAHVPAFAAVDRTGRPRTIADLSAANGVVLVFFRSAKWCPFCQAQLIDMKALQAPLAQKGYALAAVSYDPPAVLTTFGENRASATRCCRTTGRG